MAKEVRVVLSSEAKEVYDYLNENFGKSKIETSILKSLRNKIDFIKSNPHYGEPISKKLIPSVYKERYGNINLFRIELPNFWRMIYTLSEGESKIEIVAFILNIMDHKKYNKLFGYK